MTEDEVQEPAQAQEGLGRRKFLIGTAAVGAGAWAAPSILAVDRALGQEPGSPLCDTRAFDILVTAKGAVTGHAGPVRECNDGGGGSFAGGTAQIPGTSAPEGSVQVLTVSCSQDPCRAFVEIASATVDLNPLGLPVVISATTITSEATCSGGTTTRSSSIATLTVNGTSRTVGTSPNFLAVDEEIAGVHVKIVLNEQVGDTVNAIHIAAGDEIQSADVVIGSATASC